MGTKPYDAKSRLKYRNITVASREKRQGRRGDNDDGTAEGPDLGSDNSKLCSGMLLVISAGVGLSSSKSSSSAVKREPVGEDFPL